MVLQQFKVGQESVVNNENDETESGDGSKPLDQILDKEEVEGYFRAEVILDLTNVGPGRFEQVKAQNRWQGSQNEVGCAFTDWQGC